MTHSPQYMSYSINIIIVINHNNDISTVTGAMESTTYVFFIIATSVITIEIVDN